MPTQASDQTMDVLVVHKGGTRKERRPIYFWSVPASGMWLSEPIRGIRLPFPLTVEGERVYWVFGDPVPRVYVYYEVLGT